MTVRVPILMYHGVRDVSDGPLAPFDVRPSEFAAQMRALGEGGFSPLTVSNLAACYAGLSALPARPVVVTFDDGFTDFLEKALPALVAEGVPATLYVVAGLVGRTSQWLAKHGEGGRPLLDWSGIVAAHREGVEIGAHSMSHPELDDLSRDARSFEVGRSKALIEDWLGAPVSTFAYPFGFEGAAVRASVRAAGYRSACAVRYLASRPGDDPFRLPRLIVRRGTTPDAFAAVLRGTPSPTRVVDRARSRAYAALRPILRRIR